MEVCHPILKNGLTLCKRSSYRKHPPRVIKSIRRVFILFIKAMIYIRLLQLKYFQICAQDTSGPVERITYGLYPTDFSRKRPAQN